MDLQDMKDSWRSLQQELRSRILLVDREQWQRDKEIKLIAGIDLSFLKHDTSRACCTIVVCRVPDLVVVYEDSTEVQLTTPYIPGFLAFREVEPCLAAFKRLLYLKPQLAPDCVLLDGNGTLHPQGLGLACHFGITADVCTIGVAKNLYKMDDIVDQDKHKEKFVSLSEPGSFFTMHNHSGEILGVALKTCLAAKKPVFVSTGHAVSIETAVWTVMQTVNQFRIPEPIRQADIRSREYLRNKYGFSA